MKLGEEVLPILQIFSFQEVKDLGGLDPHTALIAHGVPEGMTEGSKAYMARKVWLFRPGQLVHVDLRRGSLQAGFYIPMNAIVKEGDTYSVFVVEKGAEGTEVARKVQVRLKETYGEFRRVESDQLKDGAAVILDGAHYLRDGAAINAFDEKEVKP